MIGLNALLEDGLNVLDVFVASCGSDTVAQSVCCCGESCFRRTCFKLIRFKPEKFERRELGRRNGNGK